MSLSGPDEDLDAYSKGAALSLVLLGAAIGKAIGPDDRDTMFGPGFWVGASLGAVAGYILIEKSKGWA